VAGIPGGRAKEAVTAELIVQGTREGMAAARVRGIRLGRPSALTAEQVAHAARCSPSRTTASPRSPACFGYVHESVVRTRARLVGSVIERVFLAAMGEGDELTAPPTRYLELEVISGLAHLGIREVPEGGSPAETLTAEVVVPARSLMRALTAAVEDDGAPGPAALRR
jgi:hypothetical protein